MTHKQLAEIIDALTSRVRAYVEEKLEAHARRAESADQLIAELEQRIATLEAQLAEKAERRLRAVGDE
jgi:hypothetical protein